MATDEAKTVYVEISSESEGYEDLPLYNYASLSGPDKIRILQLHSTKGDSIACTLKEIGFSEPGYQALSYVWGSEEKPARAAVRDSGGKTLGYIPLTANAHQTLQDLRDAPKITNKSFWIDQICINQAGEEKNKQVALMREIYTSAERVIFYGGSARDQQSELKGIELVERLDKHFSPNYQVIYDINSLYTTYHKRNELPVQDMPEDIKQNISEYAAAFGWLAEVGYGEWRQRLWMVQEQLLNNDLVFLRGPQLMSWNAVSAITFLFYLKLIPPSYVFDFWEKPNNSSAVQPSAKWRSPWDIALSVFSIWHPRYGANLRHEPRTLLDNIHVYEHLDCRDPRDRIYSVLAISSDSDFLGITPNYQDDPHIIFHQLSVRFLSTYTGLAPLYVASCWDNLSDPSVPSWSLHKPHPFLLRPHFVPNSYLNIAHPLSAFGIGAAPYFLQDHSILVLKGRQVDKVSLATQRLYLEKSIHLGVFDDSSANSFSKLLTIWSDILLDLGPTIENTYKLGRVLMPDIRWAPAASGTRSNVEEMVYHFWCYFRQVQRNVKTYYEATKQDIDIVQPIKSWEELLSKLTTILVEAKILDPSWSTANVSDTQKKIVTEFPSRIFIHGRSFAATKAGRVCNVMNEVKDGDVIVALQGWTRGFFVLRPVNGSDAFRVVGEAWVSGLMEGQAYIGVDPARADYSIKLI